MWQWSEECSQKHQSQKISDQVGWWTINLDDALTMLYTPIVAGESM